MRAPDELPEELEGDFHAGEIRDTRAAPECVERDRYDDILAEWDDYDDIQETHPGAGSWGREDVSEWNGQDVITEEGEPCQPN
jgi:hypothetical protein